MRENIPLPTLELIEWPDAGPVGPLELYTIDPERESALLDRLPAATDSAWDTATRMLEWVRTRWEHANDHVEDPDALNVLERVDAGARFACVEYSIVLSQVLNAVRIPARRLELRQANHHVGVGRGHVVSEAWIDDLDRWVLLDGQNGSYWVGTDGQPLGVRELQQLTEPPAFVGARGVESLSTDEAASWFSYFASVTTTGYTWSEGPFAPVFQGIGIIRTPRLVHDGDRAYPSLSALTTGLGGKVDAPTVRFTHSHPYGTGHRGQRRDRRGLPARPDPRHPRTHGHHRHAVRRNRAAVPPVSGAFRSTLPTWQDGPMHGELARSRIHQD